MPFPTLTFANLDEWENWVNLNIIPNGMELITGDDGNITENASVKFIKRSPLNWGLVQIFSSGGSVNVSFPINIFISAVPTILTWSDNPPYNEYRFINSTLGDIPSDTYYDINLTAINIVAAKSIVNISKATNNLWVVSSVPSSGSLASLPPYIGVVDRGFPTDPVSGTGVFQSNLLIGLGSTNNGDISIQYAQSIRDSFGDNKSFDYDSVLGKITLSGVEEFYPGSGLWINRNQ